MDGLKKYMDGWKDGFKKNIYIWMVERKNENKIDGWMD